MQEAESLASNLWLISHWALLYSSFRCFISSGSVLSLIHARMLSKFSSCCCISFLRKLDISAEMLLWVIWTCTIISLKTWKAVVPFALVLWILQTTLNSPYMTIMIIISSAIIELRHFASSWRINEWSTVNKCFYYHFIYCISVRTELYWDTVVARHEHAQLHMWQIW